MEDYCAFSRNHKCIKFMDYQITCLELEEADSLCHGNWIEIQRLQHYVDQLTDALEEAGVPVPDYDFYDIPDEPVGPWDYGDFDYDTGSFRGFDDDDGSDDYTPDDSDGPFGPLDSFGDPFAVGSDDDDKDY